MREVTREATVEIREKWSTSKQDGDMASHWVFSKISD